MKIQNTTVAIIAGGKSKRFGSPKYKAKFLGKPLIEWSLELAGTLSNNILIISQNRQLFEKYKVPVFPDRLPGKGPLGGILTALEKMSGDWLFVLPVDSPLLRPQIYLSLWEQKENLRPAVAVSKNGIESMVSLWHRSHAFTIETFIKEEKLKINLVLKALKAKEITFSLADQELIFSNINFKEDLQRLEILARNRD